jgi:hypothetical protein
MTKDEALDKALEALEGVVKNCWRDIPSWRLDEIKEHITAIKQARSAPVQEPVAIDADMRNVLHGALVRSGKVISPPAAQPAPVNQRAHEMALRQWESWKQYALELQEKLVKYEGGAPMVLNNTPPAAQRQWVGLTVDELITLEQKHRRHEDLSRAIESKLKEKNGM